MADKDTKGPGVEEQKALEAYERDKKLQAELDDFVAEIRDESFDLKKVDLQGLFNLVLDYAKNQGKHQESLVEKPELLEQYVAKLRDINNKINQINSKIVAGKDTERNYRQLRLSQIEFYKLLEDTIAIISGRFNEYSLGQRFNDSRLEATENKTKATEDKINVAKAKKKDTSELEKKLANLRAKHGKLERKQRKIANKQVKARYRKINAIWSTEYQHAKFQARYDYLADGDKEDAFYDEIDEIQTHEYRFGKANPYNWQWVRSLRVVLREGKTFDKTGDFRWFRFNRFGARLEKLQEKVDAYLNSDAKKIRGKTAAEIIEMYENLDEKLGRSR